MSTATPAECAVCKVCDKLRLPLTKMVGAAGYRSLLSRALTFAIHESPVLGALEIKPDGSLVEPSGNGTPVNSVLIAHLIGLLFTLIGQPVTMRLVQDVWSDLPSSKNAPEGNQSYE